MREGGGPVVFGETLGTMRTAFAGSQAINRDGHGYRVRSRGGEMILVLEGRLGLVPIAHL